MTEDEFANLMSVLRAKYRNELRENVLDWSPVSRISFPVAFSAAVYWMESPRYPPGPSAFLEVCKIFEAQT